MRLRSLLLLPALLAAGVLVAGCGGDPKPVASTTAGTSTTSTTAGGTRAGFFSDPKVVACLKKQGVDVSSFGGRGDRPSTTRTTPPTQEEMQKRQEQSEKQREQFAKQQEKLQAAMKKCGVEMPQRPSGNGNGYGPPGGGNGYGPPGGFGGAPGQQGDGTTTTTTTGSNS